MACLARRRRYGLALAGVPALSLFTGVTPDSAASDGVLDAPDPFVVLEADGPWVFTTNTDAGNVPLLTLIDGTLTVVGDALPELPEWAVAGFTWAPAVAELDGGWTLWFTATDAASGRQCIGAARAEEAQGPYQAEPEPLICDVNAGGSIDPSPVVDRSGQVTLLYKVDGNCCGLPTSIAAVSLDRSGLEASGSAVELLRADQDWEGGIIEAPSMRADRFGGWQLLYSANRWDTEDYAVGVATCSTPLGPCRKQDEPALAGRPAHAGAGGAEFVAGTRVVVLHEWSPDAVGYAEGGYRRIRLGRLGLAAGGLTIRLG